MNATKIPWCDFTWNPITGCSKISEGCQNCFAAAMSNRFGWTWGSPVLHSERLDEPMNQKKPARIFVCSMGDLFHPRTKIRWINMVFSQILRHPRHTFLILTKRPDTMQIYFSGVKFMPLPNVWLGITAENQAHADERIPILLQIPAAVRFVSCEPMLESIDLGLFLPGISRHYENTISWAITGPETGPGARHCDPAWIQSLADQCQAAGVPFFDKRTPFIRREFPAP